jgi:hypothetical protein
VESLKAEALATEQLALKQLDLQSSLKGATDAQIAQVAITELGTLFEEGKISLEDYKTAVTETQIAFGLADEQSIKLTEGVLALTEQFAAGEIKAGDFDESLQALITDTELEVGRLELFNEQLDKLPEQKTVRINVEYAGGGAAGVTTGGGTVNNTTNYNLNQTVNTQASSHNVVSDFRTAQALVE